MSRGQKKPPKSRYLAEACASARVTVYDSYREYLHDVYTEIKNRTESYSYIQFNLDLGFSRSNFLRSVIKGTRSLTRKSALQVADALSLQGIDRAYFKALIACENESKQARKNILYKKLLRLKAEAQPEAVAPALIMYFSEWYFPVIKELVSIYNGELGVDDIDRLISLPLSKKKLVEGIAVLKEIGFIREEGGKFFVKQSVVKMPHGTESLALINFHLNMMDRSKEALEVVKDRDREFLAATVNLGEVGFAHLREGMRALVGQALDLEAEDLAKSDRKVVQLNMQMFKISNEGSDD